MGHGVVSRCPNCGSRMVNYDGHYLDQYCPKCDFEVSQSGKWKNYKPNLWIND